MFNKNAFTTTYPFISIIQQELLSQGGWKGNVTEVVRFKHCNKKKNHPLKGARYTSSNFKGLGVRGRLTQPGRFWRESEAGLDQSIREKGGSRTPVP